MTSITFAVFSLLEASHWGQPTFKVGDYTIPGAGGSLPDIKGLSTYTAENLRKGFYVTKVTKFSKNKIIFS